MSTGGLTPKDRGADLPENTRVIFAYLDRRG